VGVELVSGSVVVLFGGDRGEVVVRFVGSFVVEPVPRQGVGRIFSV
jgi:hypothetical protein